MLYNNRALGILKYLVQKYYLNNKPYENRNKHNLKSLYPYEMITNDVLLSKSDSLPVPSFIETKKEISATNSILGPVGVDL